MDRVYKVRSDGIAISLAFATDDRIGWGEAPSAPYPLAHPGLDPGIAGKGLGWPPSPHRAGEGSEKRILRQSLYETQNSVYNLSCCRKPTRLAAPGDEEEGEDQLGETRRSAGEFFYLNRL
jgi:hypothetical protein